LRQEPVSTAPSADYDQAVKLTAAMRSPSTTAARKYDKGDYAAAVADYDSALKLVRRTSWR